MAKTKVAIIGTGNIGTDLMLKIAKTSVLELVGMIGIDVASEGIQRAKELGYTTTSKGLEDFLNGGIEVDIFFDATSAKAHEHHAQLVREAGKLMIDMTPAAIGELVVPPVNLQKHKQVDNINLITCGGQATIPMVHALSRVAEVAYAEIIATIASKSAGPGTRANIDEFTRTTARAIEEVGGAQKGKAIIILNPAEPPILMRNTIHAQFKDNQVNLQKVLSSIQQMEAEIQTYVPGYRLRNEPIIEGNQISIFIEVEGAGDNLPKYAGNLDIMTAAGVKVAEEYARILQGQGMGL